MHQKSHVFPPKNKIFKQKKTKIFSKAPVVRVALDHVIELAKVMACDTLEQEKLKG